jgi:phosphate transport system substrate-binding protein
MKSLHPRFAAPALSAALALFMSLAFFACGPADTDSSQTDATPEAAESSETEAQAETEASAVEAEPTAEAAPSGDDSAAAAALPAGLPSYQKVSGVNGTLNAIGSDTLNNLMEKWTHGFKTIYPNVSTSIQGLGSSSAPPALIEGTAQLGPMSREMKQEEVDEFVQAFGYEPTMARVAIDALAVFIHKDNPIEGLTLAEVDAMYSSTRKRGHAPITTWGAAGLEGEWANRAISLFGRNSASGTYGFFKSVVLEKGDYLDSVKEQPGSSAVVGGVATDPYAVGYSGIGYLTSGVRACPLGETEGQYYEANMENCLSGEYPLARFLMIYVNKKPNEPLDQLTLEFLKFVKSAEGQKLVADEGYYPLPPEVAKADLAALQ